MNILSMFKRTAWTPSSVPVAHGTHQGLAVAISNLPCLKDPGSEKRKYPYPDFGHDFLMELHKAIGDKNHARLSLEAGAQLTASIELREYPPIGVAISGKPHKSAQMFDSDVADLLISAFTSVGIGR
jgi:hypothetical protein